MSLLKHKAATIMNSRTGKPVVLNAAEKYHAQLMQAEVNKRFFMHLKNSLGYEIPISTLTTIMKEISEQKFFEIAPADYFPVKVGEGAWSATLTTYRSFELADAFETGIMNTGGQNARMASADAGVDAVNIKVFNWAKSIGWSIFDLELAAKSGNWDLISAKEEARKKNFDLGLQRIAFLGADGQNGSGGNCLGYLNQAGVTVNTTLITKPISSMTPTELKTFMAGLIEAYRTNCERTAWPAVFTIPESDYNGLASQASPDFPIKSTLELLEEALKLITRNKSFKIMPLAYGDAAYNAAAGINKQKYVLSSYDEKSLNMTIPVPYTNTLANSIDNFSFQNAGYAQFSGVVLLRSKETMYFQY